MNISHSMSDGEIRHGVYVSVIGSPVDFYVFVKERDGQGDPSKWIKGCSADFHELKRLHKKDRPAFVAKVRELFTKHGYMHP